jgi:hypothetical protein
MARYSRGRGRHSNDSSYYYDAHEGTRSLETYHHGTYASSYDRTERPSIIETLLSCTDCRDSRYEDDYEYDYPDRNPRDRYDNHPLPPRSNYHYDDDRYRRDYSPKRGRGRGYGSDSDEHHSYSSTSSREERKEKRKSKSDKKSSKEKSSSSDKKKSKKSSKKDKKKESSKEKSSSRDKESSKEKKKRRSKEKDKDKDNEKPEIEDLRDDKIPRRESKPELREIEAQPQQLMNDGYNTFNQLSQKMASMFSGRPNIPHAATPSTQMSTPLSSLSHGMMHPHQLQNQSQSTFVNPNSPIYHGKGQTSVDPSYGPPPAMDPNHAMEQPHMYGNMPTDPHMNTGSPFVSVPTQMSAHNMYPNHTQNLNSPQTTTPRGSPNQYSRSSHPSLMGNQRKMSSPHENHEYQNSYHPQINNQPQPPPQKQIQPQPPVKPVQAKLEQPSQGPKVPAMIGNIQDMSDEVSAITMLKIAQPKRKLPARARSSQFNDPPDDVLPQRPQTQGNRRASSKLQQLQEGGFMETQIPPGDMSIVLSSTPDGLMVEQVSDRSVAKNLLHPGDVIVALDGVDVSRLIILVSSETIFLVSYILHFS